MCYFPSKCLPAIISNFHKLRSLLLRNCENNLEGIAIIETYKLEITSKLEINNKLANIIYTKYFNQKAQQTKPKNNQLIIIDTPEDQEKLCELCYLLVLQQEILFFVQWVEL